MLCYIVIFAASRFVPISRFVWWFAHVPRLSRAPELMRFFREKEMDVHFDMSVIALFKFVLLVYGAAHCLGCMFYALSVFEGEFFDVAYQPFSILYSERGSIEYNYRTSDRSQAYFVCLFKGDRLASSSLCTVCACFRALLASTFGVRVSNRPPPTPLIIPNRV